ncbi:MAG: hypothetical protein ACW99G_21975 [Candidatus Thorarchaeota archaeon]|jgi:hypothetical protein
MANKKSGNKKDPAAQIWESFPDISSLSFILDEDGLHVLNTNDLPEEFHELGFTMDPYEYGRHDMASKIRKIAESGGRSRVKNLLIILKQLMKRVSTSTHVYAKIAGGYDNFTPGVVWCRVLDWVIVHLRDRHNRSVVKPLIEVLYQISEFNEDEWLSGDIFRILSHYMSNDEINTLRSQYEQQKVDNGYLF